MKSRTCRYSIIIGQNAHLMKRLISLLLLFCIGLPLLAQQQRPTQTPKRDQKKKEVAEIDTIPLYNGTYIGVDLYGIGSKLLGGDFMSSEVSVAVNLKNKFIPTFEFGMGGTDTWNETGIHYKSKMAPFFRIGVDYNTMAKKKEKNSYLYAGLRYAFSSFKYDVSTMPADDPIWGDAVGNPSLGDGYWGGSVPFSHLGMKGSVQWLEIVLGVKVRIYKNFNMGWSVRMKYKTKASTGEYGNHLFPYLQIASLEYNDRTRDLVACNRSGDGLFRCLHCKRYHFEAYPMETHANHGFYIRTFSSNHAFYRMDVRQKLQPFHRKYRPLDCLCHSCLPWRQNDLGIFQRRRVLPAIQPDQSESGIHYGRRNKHRRAGSRYFVCLFRSAKL